MSSINSNDKLVQDPDYVVPLENNKNHQSICEKNALCTAKKISKILETEFSKEIDAKKKEIFTIYETLHKACKILHYLRFAIVTDYYNQENAFIDGSQPFKQSRLHPTVNAPVKKIDVNIDCKNDCYQTTNKCNKTKRKISSDHNVLNESGEPKQKIFKGDIESPSVGNRKIKIRIVVGNYSKWIPPHCRENNDATHKWTVYIIDSQKKDLGNFVSKVRFFLHPSYKPNDVIELTSSPFILSRLGWGEFPIRVQLHFKNNLNKPVDIIHNLTLDRTYTGILTIGSETVVDIWIITTDKFLPLVEDKTNANDFSSGDINNTSNVPLPVVEEKDENIALEEERENNLTKQDDHENLEGTTAIFNDHDYIRTNFIPIKLENKRQESEHFLTRFKKNKSLLKSNRENISCTITVDKGKVISSNQNHNFDELPSSANLQTKLARSKQNFNIEKFYTDPENYAPDKEHAKKLISLIELAKPQNLFNVLTLVIRNIPLITEKSKDEYYKLLFPYTCESYQVFSNYTLGKQHALERYRALHALDIMRDIQCFESSCSVKEFMIWARRFGYTPLLNLKDLSKLSRKTIGVGKISENHNSSATISIELNDWLLKCQNIKPSIKAVINDSDDDIDIINIESSVSNPSSCHRDSKTNESNVILLDHPQKFNSLNEFVCKSTEEIGIKLTNEEIIPGVSHSSASLVITKALECLVDELTRSALSCAIDKHSGEKNLVDFKVEVNDIYKALLRREEFDIFTNAGLGSEG